MFDVVGIGLNAIDYLVALPRFPVPGEKLRMSAFVRGGGGQVATALVALSRWGRRCEYVGNVGDDEHGRLSSLLLSREGIDLSHVRTVPGATSQFAVILVEEGTGERTILWDRDPRIRVTPEQVPMDEIRRARALLPDGHDVPAAIAAARPPGARGSPSFSTRKRCRRGRRNCSEEEFVKRAGFVLMAALSVHDKKSSDKAFEKFFPIIVRESKDERNFVKKAVNWALRQIGKRSPALNKKAVEFGERISKIDSRSARWIAADALRELKSDKVKRRLAEKSRR